MTAFVLLFMVAHAPLAFAEEIEFFAGAASKPACEEVVRLFEAETGIGVKTHFGSSGQLLSQMKIAKRGDIYFPGSPDFMKRAREDGAIVPDTERIVAYLVPAISVQKGNPKGILGLDDLARKDVKFVIANPDHVCVGLYAVEVLEHSGLAAKVRPNIAGYTESCDKTASIIALKGADAALGWSVFESWNPDKIQTVPLKPEQIPRIGYIPIAVSSFSKKPELAKRLIDYICSESGGRVFKKWGYITREEDARRFAPAASTGGDYHLPERW
jgi:molybdate transport system substrate-binding protein